MSHTANFLIALGIVSVFIVLPYLYQMIKWHSSSAENWASFTLADDLKPENLRFSVLTGNLVIGKKEMPRPIYSDLPNLDKSLRQWLVQTLINRVSTGIRRGKSDAANITTTSRKAFSFAVNALYIAGILPLLWRNLGLTPVSIPKAILTTWLVAMVFGLSIHALYFNSWIASQDGLTIGRWFFKLLIPWADIKALSLGFPREHRSGFRRSTFMLRLRYKDKALEIYSGKLVSLLPLYDAITSFRSDLKLRGAATDKDTASLVQQYLEYARYGDRDSALHGLIEMKHDALPELIAEFKKERDNRIRALLVHVIWQHRQHSVTPFLAETLHDSNSDVWKEAMDGLVTLASPQSVDALRSARSRQFSRKKDRVEFIGWLDEAIEQAEKTIQNEKHHNT